MPSPKGTSSGVQHGIPLTLCRCTTKTSCRQLAAPGSGEEEEEGVAARPHQSWAIQPGRGTCAWQLSLSLSTMTSPPPCQHQHKAPCRVPRQLQPRESQAGGVEWGDVIDGEV